ncbi:MULTISPECIES: DUF2332 domain-containing protein [unclassified Microbacterium]|uniref:DUF2332 domain-containing protein n=1 Tax=unclassified Microbacterium TaxID=2609290 RepID=UPI000EAA9ECA|nr:MULTISPECIES: DUF2332 domain-containing protein [unclassified Microbacterium]MBT2483167.1 DUF2332 domain-containing protein [Microbacterium sp. ISL-108]RKN66224.1 DUF2332 domain-containing protein [Microbacterium sp. CGR2]
MTDAVQQRYARFARLEAPGRSALYAEWAAGVAEDPEAQRILTRIPETRRQPPLVFAVTRLLGVGQDGYPAWRRFLLEHADRIVAECGTRRLQTNDPLRLAALLPVLSEIDGPLALLEVGASAGLCLYPDRYSYRFHDAGGGLRFALDPVDGPSEVVLESRVHGSLPALRMPDVVWRAGIDLAPLDAADEGDRRWLRGLVWPGETGREERIDAALDIAAADPPHLVAGDAAAHLQALADQAPDDATLVITTPGVLVHIPRAERTALVDRITRLAGARWVTIDPPGLLDIWEPAVDAADWPGFVVALDGRVRAAADPLGGWWEWRAGSAADAS